MTVEWTPELRALVTPRTAADVRPPTCGAKEAFEKLRPRLEGSKAGEGLRKIAERTRAKGAPDAADLAERAAAWLAAETLPPPDAPTFAAALVMLGLAPPIFDLFAHAARADVVLATEAVIATHEWQLKAVAGSWNEYALTREPSGPRMPLPLRAAVLVADDDARSAALEIAARAWPGATRDLRTTLLMAFPQRPEWAAEQARAILADPSWRYPPVDQVLCSLAEPELVAPLLARRQGLGNYLDLVATFEDAALPALLAHFAAKKPQWDWERLTLALSAYPTFEVADAFVDHLGKKGVREIAIDWLLRHPELAKRALARPRTGRVGSIAADVAAQLERAEGAPVSSVVAPEEALPWVLARPPWAGAKAPRRKRAPALEIAPLPYEERVLFDAKQVSSLLDALPRDEMDAGEAAEWVAAVARKEQGVGPFGFKGKAVPAADVLRAYLEAWEFPNITRAYMHHWQVLAKCGVAALGPFVRYVETAMTGEGRRWFHDYLDAIDAPRVGAAIVGWSRGAFGALASHWYARHPEAAAIALVPIVAGRGKRAPDAEARLRWLAARGHERAILDVGERHGPEVLAAIRAALAFDRRWDAPRRPPKMPPTWAPARFPRPTLSDGRPLSDAAVGHLGVMLAISTLDEPYPGLEDVRAACAPRSLAAFAWAAARAWDLAGGARGSAWMLDAIAHLGDDDVTRRATEIRRPRVLDVLGAIATDAAALEVMGLALRARDRKNAFDAAAAEARLDAIAARRGLSKDELEDRVTPAVGLDEEGGATLDYGPRALRVGFDTHLEPFVVGPSGERNRALPPKRKTDDPAKVRAAKARWQGLKDDVATIAVRRVAALERAMAWGRIWSLDDFDACWVRHPLLAHLARGVVWSARRAGGAIAFRVAEDGSFADVGESPVVLAPGDSVGVAHALELGADAARWARTFDDYEVLPAIEQLGRASYPILDEERARSSFVRASAGEWADVEAWLVRAGFSDASWYANKRRQYVTLRRTPGVTAQSSFTTSRPIQVEVSLTRARAPFLVGDLDPIDASELMRAAACPGAPPSRA